MFYIRLPTRIPKEFYLFISQYFLWRGGRLLFIGGNTANTGQKLVPYIETKSPLTWTLKRGRKLSVPICILLKTKSDRFRQTYQDQQCYTDITPNSLHIIKVRISNQILGLIGFSRTFQPEVLDSNALLNFEHSLKTEAFIKKIVSRAAMELPQCF